MAKPKDQVDWERVEADFRAGLLSVREIARVNKVSHTLVQRKASEHGWERDLDAKIREKAKALVAKRAVAMVVAKTTEAATVDANATLLATVAIGQRRLTDKSVKILSTLLDELEAVVDAPEVFGQVHGLLLNGETPDPDLMNRLASLVVSLPERAKLADTLVSTLNRAIAGQRRVYSMDEDQKSADAVDSFEHLLEMADDMLGRLKS